MSTIMSFHKVTDINASFEGFEVLPLPLTQKEEGFLAQAKHASHFDSEQKITFAVTLMKKEGFATMAPQTMGRIFEAFHFTFKEKMDLERKIFFINSLDPCADILMKASQFKPHDFEPINNDSELEKNSKLLRTINATSSFVSSGIDTIFGAPFAFAAKLMIGGNKNN